MLETYHGGCHCGRVRFRIRADLGTIGECNCSICTKKGILHLPVLPLSIDYSAYDNTTGSRPNWRGLATRGLLGLLPPQPM